MSIQNVNANLNLEELDFTPGAADLERWYNESAPKTYHELNPGKPLPQPIRLDLAEELEAHRSQTAKSPTVSEAPEDARTDAAAKSAPAASPFLVQKATPKLVSKWSVRSPRQLKERITELGAQDYVIDGILPVRSIGLLVGDSGMGKSPLAYQMAISIAAGVDFLGHAVSKSRTVLYMDFENGLAQVDEMVGRIAGHLGVNLENLQSTLSLWNANDAPRTWGQRDHTFIDLIEDLRPSVIFVDSLGSWYPDIEEKNANVNKAFGQLRTAISNFGPSVVTIHHLKKPSSKPEEQMASLEEEDPRRWLLQARGPRAIVNSSDVRIGVDKPSLSTSRKSDGHEVAIVLAGFGRVKGDIPLTYLARQLDENGDPLGYRRLLGVELLFNVDHKAAYNKLTDPFRFKDAKLALEKGDQATTDFLRKCISIGIVRKEGKGYRKVEVPD